MMFLLGASCSGLFAADSGALKNLALEHTTITIAETVTSGTLTNPGDGTVLGGLSAFCHGGIAICPCHRFIPIVGS